MQVTESPQALPGSCYLCGSGTRGRYVDTECSVEFHGAMYICDICVALMANLLDMPTPADHARQEQELVGLRERVFELTTKSDGLEQAVNGMVLAGRSVSSSSPDPLPAPVEQPAALESDGVVEAEPRETVGDVGGGEGTPPEPLHGEGVDELHTDVVSDASQWSLSL